MDVVIFPSHDSNIPVCLKPLMTKDESWRWSSKVINFLRSLTPDENLMIDEVAGLFYFKNENAFCGIMPVDISRPWTIQLYDGSEYIQYLDIKVVDAKVNYCEFID